MTRAGETLHYLEQELIMKTFKRIIVAIIGIAIITIIVIASLLTLPLHLFINIFKSKND